MNKVILIGRLTSNPELRYTSSSIAVTSFNLAVDRTYGEEKKTDFIPIVVWRKQAENVCKFCDKGSLVAIDGNVQMREYEDKECKKRIAFEVVAENVQFLSTKSKEDGQAVENKTEEKETDPFADFGNRMYADEIEINDEDLPF